MRPQCRGCCLSRSAVPEDWGRYDLSNVPGRTGEMRLTVVVVRAQCAEFLTQRHILSMKRGTDQTIALIVRRVQGIGSGLHPESDFENTSRLFICTGNKNSGAVFCLTGKPLRPSLRSSRRVYFLHQETLSLQERHWKSGIPCMDQDSKRFIFAEEFIRRAQWIEGYSHDK